MVGAQSADQRPELKNNEDVFGWTGYIAKRGLADFERIHPECASSPLRTCSVTFMRPSGPCSLGLANSTTDTTGLGRRRASHGSRSKPLTANIPCPGIARTYCSWDMDTSGRVDGHSDDAGRANEARPGLWFVNSVYYESSSKSTRV